MDLKHLWINHNLNVKFTGWAIGLLFTFGRAIKLANWSEHNARTVVGSHLYPRYLSQLTLTTDVMAHSLQLTPNSDLPFPETSEAETPLRPDHSGHHWPLNKIKSGRSTFYSLPDI
jgi:hypothetical protein